MTRSDLAFSLAVEVAGGPVAEQWSEVDPETLTTMLQRHKLLGASEAFSHRMGPEQIQALQPAWRLMTARQLARSAERERILELLTAHNVFAIEYKGSAQHLVLHGTEHGRDSVDLDLWVDPLHFRRSLKLLCAHGYRPHTGLPVDRFDGHLPNELPLIHEHLSLEVDLHQHLFTGFYALDEVDEALRHELDGHRLHPRATSFLALIVAGKDLWNTLRTVADIHAIPAEHNAWIDRMAHRTNTQHIVTIGRNLAHQVFGGGAPDKSFEVVGWIQRLREDRLDAPTLVRARLYLGTRESLRSRARCVRRLPFDVRYQDLLVGPIEAGSVFRRLRRLTRTYLQG